MGTPTATAASIKCRAAIAKNSAAFVQAKIKILQKCRESIVKGKFTADCSQDVKTQDAITKAANKAKAAIASSCGGKNKACSRNDIGKDTDVGLSDVGWAGTCPNVENSPDPECSQTIMDCNAIGECVTCIGEKAVDQAISLDYSIVPSTDKVVNKCQLAIGKSAAAFFAAKSKALQKCWDTVNKDTKGVFRGPCPVPGDGKTQAAIDKAESKKIDTICKACGGGGNKNGHCNLPGLSASAIAFAPTCPPVGSCGGAIGTLDELVRCVDCVSELTVDCVDLAQSRGFPNVPPYPAECNP